MIYALGYNLLLGYAGLPSFGHGAYFGVGAYAFGLLQQHVGAGPVGRPASARSPSRRLAGALVAAFISHRRGIYYALLTIAFGQVFWFVAIKWHSVTGGEDGLLNIKRLPLDLGFADLRHREATRRSTTSASRSSCVVVLFLWRLVHSPFGRVLTRDQAERDARALRRLQRLAVQVARVHAVGRWSRASPAACSRWRSSRPTRT